MGTRRKSRELALQMLFQADMGKQTPELVRKTFWAERTNVEEEVRGFADDLFRVASDRLTEIDELIGKHTQHWRMERMATVDRNVLRGAVAEFLGFPATPRSPRLVKRTGQRNSKSHWRIGSHVACSGSVSE